MARVSHGPKEKASFCIADAQSIRNADTAEHKGYDEGKKVSGIKRHIVVDSQGLPHAFAITTANVTDRKGALLAITQYQGELSAVENVLVDSGYIRAPFAGEVDRMLGASVDVAKRTELHKFAVIPKRWVVERSFG